ncbi:MAG: hypothetical protein ABI113_05685 [Mucilaginibacter sp.]
MSQKKNLLFDVVARPQLDALNKLFEISPREYFVRLFKSDFEGNEVLNIFIENKFINAETLEWDFKKANKTELATILRYLKGKRSKGEYIGLLLKEDTTNKELSDIALKAFRAPISPNTIDTAKYKSNIIDRLEGL